MNELKVTAARVDTMDAQAYGRKTVPSPACGKAMIERWGRKGKFLGCSGYPKCKNAKPLPSDRN